MKTRLSRLTRNEALWGYIFIAPWLIGFLVFKLAPMLASAYFSLTDYAIIAAPKFLGLSNYVKMFTNDPSFWDALKVTMVYAALSVPLGLICALVLALLMNQKLPGITVWRTVFYLPSVVAGVAIAMLWVWIFHSEFGLLNMGLRALGIEGPAWLADPDWVLIALVIMSLWGVGGNMIINLAGLQGIPYELYEAAEIDGANRWHCFWSVTLPMLTPVLFFTLITGIIETFQYFTNAFVMTNGGPGRATLFYNLYLYRNAFAFYKLGYASALAWVMFLIILAFTILIFKSSPYWVYYEGVIRSGKSSKSK